MQNKPNHRLIGSGGLSSISGALTHLGEKVQRTCRDCDAEFEATNLGVFTSRYCRPCSLVRERQIEERERLALVELGVARHNEMVRLAHIPPKWQKVTFATSDPKLNPPLTFQCARQYAEDFNTGVASLIMYSPGPGTGKTHLLACIANYVLHEKKLGVLYQKARDLMLDIRRTFSDKNGESEADVLDRVLSVPLLVLDDVGVDPASDWLKATYWTVFDRRLEYQLPVVISTNKPLESLKGERLADRIGDRAASRIVELCHGQLIDMSGPDLR